jgi:hypothetical protein
MEERGVNVDHATLNRWVIRYAPTIAAKAHSQKRNTNRSWRMDETYIKVKGKSLGKCVPLKLIMILFYAHWEIRVNYLKNHLDLRQNPKKPIHDGSQKNELNGYVQLLFPSPPFPKYFLHQ